VCGKNHANLTKIGKAKNYFLSVTIAPHFLLLQEINLSNEILMFFALQKSQNNFCATIPYLWYFAEIFLLTQTFKLQKYTNN
jgi:uncharacterized membrane protein (GlpM family)